ncbi:hypothetical protein [Allobaculum sp. Allo2]|uniref:hypothetical protein n=1 Tax=Allobaculum sp. Allo2 TaxID=2853432 RepID=UPI003461B5A8
MKPINQVIKTMKPSGIRKYFDLANSMEGVISWVSANQISIRPGTFPTRLLNRCRAAIPTTPQTAV